MVIGDFSTALEDRFGVGMMWEECKMGMKHVRVGLLIKCIF